jgi:hypothetical protein
VPHDSATASLSASRALNTLLLEDCALFGERLDELSLDIDRAESAYSSFNTLIISPGTACGAGSGTSGIYSSKRPRRNAGVMEFVMLRCIVADRQWFFDSLQHGS